MIILLNVYTSIHAVCDCGVPKCRPGIHGLTDVLNPNSIVGTIDAYVVKQGDAVFDPNAYDVSYEINNATDKRSTDVNFEVKL